ncbi:MAG: hypothetical protein JWM19_3462 [Actinomycetia bacterium]|nr:hypothetical protein [Actinomycetes bacterium]
MKNPRTQPVRLARRLIDMAPAIPRLPGTLLLSALALAGCAVVPPATAAGHAATPTAHPAAATAQSPEQRAEADAAAILAAFVVPPGARKLPGAPAGRANQLKNIAGSSASPNWIDKAGFWQVKGDPQQVLAWTASHVGRSHISLPVITNLPVPERPDTVWERDYALPPVPAVEDTRELTVEVADAGNGQTAIRVDAQVTWLPARQASETVPAAATAVTLSVIPDPNLNKKPPQPVTITSPAAVRRITALVNSLPVFPPGPIGCGGPDGSGTAALALTFLAAPQGRVLATAMVEQEGCEPVLFAAGGTKIINDSSPGVAMLGVPHHGNALAVTVLKAVGLKWNLASYSFPAFS